ncbi:MAG: archaeosortase/exosortase family protein, partial [Nitrospiraceae bacterium]|nr:archaeosortase/exosortase family protein [Nitrospiraceae bacterium]
WTDRPPSQPVQFVTGIAAIGVLLFFLLLPIRVIQEANPDWRPLNWVHAGVVVAICATALMWIGGRRWVCHFGVPLLLIFFALPWPLAIEQGVIQFLTRHVTTGTAEMLNGCGIPAFPRGNVIELASGLVGVNEACSGIRSLAATLMAAAFFGEFYRLRWLVRAVLVAVGVGVAFVLNVVRAFVLAYLQAEYGAETLHRWHDMTGVAIFAVSFAILWGAAAFLSRWSGAGRWVAASSFSVSKLFPTKIPILLPLAALLWIIAIELATGVWFKTRERALPPATTWTMQWPSNSHAFRFAEVPDEVKSILRYSEAATGTIREPGTPTWQIYFLRWDAGRTSAQLAVMHRPEICLPATGMRQVADSGVTTVHAHGLAMPFHGSVFDDGNQRLYVYRCLWEDRGASQDNTLDISLSGRLKATWQGRRNTGQRLVQVVIFGARNEQEAREDLVRRIPELISVT